MPMLGQTIRDHLRATPFEPFVIQMTDDRQFEVPHPEFATINPQATQFAVVKENGNMITLSTLLIASVEPLRPTAH